MGLDAVEIVMAVEDAFGIQLEDSEVEAVVTPGQLIDLVLKRVAVVDSKACLTQRAFNLLRNFCVQSWAMQRAQLRPVSPMSALVPTNRRRDFATALATALDVPPPPLVRPSWLARALVTVALLSGAAVALASEKLGSASLVLGLLAAALVGFLLRRLTEPLKREFREDVFTVGSLARWIMRSKPGLAAPETPAAWTREQVASRVRAIIIGQLGCEAAYREDARFVQDLGLG